MQILRIDLDKRRSELFQDDLLRQEALGGVGLTTALLYRYTSRSIDSLAPENNLFIATGALTGTNAPTASRSEASAISPGTGYFGTASSGGGLGAALRFAGLDALWIAGRSDEPVYITIDDGNAVAIKDARTLWGLDSYQLLDVLKKTEGESTEIACIGNAGEGCVRCASIQNGYHHAFGRTGLGAVMGSKRLKAICIRGTGFFRPHNKTHFAAVVRKMRERIINSPTFGYTRRYGSLVVSDVYDKLGMLPARNFREGSLDDWQATRGRKVFEVGYKERDIACFACPIGCMSWAKVKEGTWAGLETKALEVTFDLEFGAKLGLRTMPEIFMCGEACNRLGMDVISAASIVAFALELFEKGIITTDDVGFELRYGDFKSIYRLIHMIGMREGVGHVLAEGVKRAKAHFEGSEEAAMEIKGLEMPVRDPRGRFDSWILGYLTNPRGGDHLRLRTPTDDLTDVERNYRNEPLALSAKEIEDLDIPETIRDQVFGNPPSRVDFAPMSKYAEELILLLNSVGLCNRVPVLRTIGPSILAEALNALYGCDIDEMGLLAAAEKLFNMEHLFNLQRGITIEEFRFPDRFYNESIRFVGGKREALDRAEVEGLLQEYFALRGWDERAQVKKETLERLRLNQ